MKKSFEICQDRDGTPIGVDFLVRVEREGRKPWRGWVVEYTEKLERVLVLLDSKRLNTRYAKLDTVKVVAATTLEKARRKGQGKAIRETSESARRARRVSSGRTG